MELRNRRGRTFYVTAFAGFRPLPSFMEIRRFRKATWTTNRSQSSTTRLRPSESEIVNRRVLATFEETLDPPLHASAAAPSAARRNEITDTLGFDDSHRGNLGDEDIATICGLAENLVACSFRERFEKMAVDDEIRSWRISFGTDRLAWSSCQ